MALWILENFVVVFILTWGPQEEENSYPVNPEEHEGEEGQKRLQD